MITLLCTPQSSCCTFLSDFEVPSSRLISTSVRCLPRIPFLFCSFLSGMWVSIWFPFSLSLLFFFLLFHPIMWRGCCPFWRFKCFCWHSVDVLYELSWAEASLKKKFRLRPEASACVWEFLLALPDVYHVDFRPAQPAPQLFKTFPWNLSISPLLSLCLCLCLCFFLYTHTQTHTQTCTYICTCADTPTHSGRKAFTSLVVIFLVVQ